MHSGHISSVGIELICAFEGFRNAAYPDVAGIWTIGYGTTRVNGRPVVQGMTCTLDEAKQWLVGMCANLDRVVAAVDAGHKLTQAQFDACVCFAYNIGAGGFSQSTVARKIRSGNIDGITESNFTVWNKFRNGQNELVESAGLTRRRRAEYHLFRTGTIKTQF